MPLLQASMHESDIDTQPLVLTFAPKLGPLCEPLVECKLLDSRRVDSEKSLFPRTNCVEQVTSHIAKAHATGTFTWCNTLNGSIAQHPSLGRREQVHCVHGDHRCRSATASVQCSLAGACLSLHPTLNFVVRVHFLLLIGLYCSEGTYYQRTEQIKFAKP